MCVLLRLNRLCDVYEPILGWHELGVVELTALCAVLRFLWLSALHCARFLATHLILRELAFFLERFNWYNVVFLVEQSIELYVSE